MHPLLAFPSRKRTDSGKIAYIPVRQASSQDIDQYFGKGALSWKKDANVEVYPILLPCGKCIGCRLDKSREWALRCMMELKTTQNGIASFLTLTYNESSVPITYYSDPDTGLALPALTLRLDDLQRFWKRLRKSLPDKKIRYFACAEYGGVTFRPHYHAIVFGYWPDDTKLIRQCDSTAYYSSESLNSCWNSGNVLVAPVNFDTCAYVARYTAKKSLTLGDDFFLSHNMEVPKLLMSRRPGIGWQYMQDHKSFFKSNRIYVQGDNPCDGVIPRSFLNKLEEIDSELFAEIKQLRKVRGNVYERAQAMSLKTPYSKLLEDAEANLLARSRAIQRNKV